jgi:hypothetical protein
VVVLASIPLVATKVKHEPEIVWAVGTEEDRWIHHVFVSQSGENSAGILYSFLSCTMIFVRSSVEEDGPANVSNAIHRPSEATVPFTMR